MPIVAVTGATGKSGQFFLKRLAEESKHLNEYTFRLLIRSICNNEKGKEGRQLIDQIMQNSDLKIEKYEADLNNVNSLRKWFGSGDLAADTLLHISGIENTLKLVPVALESGVNHLILVHTTGIYSKYKSAGEEYRQIEATIREQIEEYRHSGEEVTLTILRPTMIYGDLEDRNVSIFIRMVDKLRLFPVINGARYDLQPVWCRDLGYAYYDVLMNLNVTANKNYTLSGGAPIQLRNMLCEIAKQLHAKNAFVSVPFGLALAGAWVLYGLSFLKIDFREKVRRMVEPRAYSHTEAFCDFGYNPVSFEIGVQEEINMYMKAVKHKVKEHKLSRLKTKDITMNERMN